MRDVDQKDIARLRNLSPLRDQQSVEGIGSGLLPCPGTWFPMLPLVDFDHPAIICTRSHDTLLPSNPRVKSTTRGGLESAASGVER
jgi:hypothetical protein